MTFTYPGRQGPVLQNVSFKVEPGERVAILLGHVGSGKTTVGRLIAGSLRGRLRHGAGGLVWISARSRPPDLRENLRYFDTGRMADVPTSIEENISLGAVDSTAEQVLWAGDLAGVSEFANRHPDGYKLKLRERGESLSGGTEARRSRLRKGAGPGSLLGLISG